MPNKSVSAKNTKYQGLRGWLAYFILGLFISVGFSLYNAYTYLIDVSEYGDYSGAIIGLGLAFGALAAGQIAGLVLIFKRKRLAIRTVIWLLCITLVIYATDAGVAQDIYNAADMETPANLYTGLARTLILAPIWVLYFLRSKRVVATFTK